MKNSLSPYLRIGSSNFRTLVAFFCVGLFFLSVLQATNIENGKGSFINSVEPSFPVNTSILPKSPGLSIPTPSFIPNKGQFSPDVYARLPLNLGDVWLTKTGIWITLFPENQMEKLHERVDLMDTLNGSAIHLEIKNARFNEPSYYGQESKSIIIITKVKIQKTGRI